MTAAAVKYANLEKYVYWLLLATIAVIPLQQEVSSAMVAVTGFSGFIVAFLRRHEKRKPVVQRKRGSGECSAQLRLALPRPAARSAHHLRDSARHRPTQHLPVGKDHLGEG